MAFKNFINSIIQRFHRENTQATLSREALATFHWKIIAVSFLSATVLVFVSSFLIYRDINLSEFLPAERKNVGDSSLVTAELLEKTIDYYLLLLNLEIGNLRCHSRLFGFLFF